MLSLLPLLGRQPVGVLQATRLANLTVEGLGRKVPPLSVGQALAALFGRRFTKPNSLATGEKAHPVRISKRSRPNYSQPFQLFEKGLCSQ